VIDDEALAAQFQIQHTYLHVIAYGMVGSHADADDAIHEAWLRLACTGGDGIDHLHGWLTGANSRICLDVLRRCEASSCSKSTSAHSRGRRSVTCGSIPRKRPCFHIGLTILRGWVRGETGTVPRSPCQHGLIPNWPYA
jgi:hypothetical protein